MLLVFLNKNMSLSLPSNLHMLCLPPRTRSNALACLNELVTDALELIPECIAYMRTIKHPEVFRFCAIPQVRSVLSLLELRLDHTSDINVMYSQVIFTANGVSRPKSLWEHAVLLGSRTTSAIFPCPSNCFRNARLILLRSWLSRLFLKCIITRMCSAAW